MQDPRDRPTERTWVEKFRDAFRGVKAGVRGQSSFFVHFFLAAAVIAAAAIMEIGLTGWCLLLLCIALVLTAEMFNSALEWMGRAMTDQFNPDLGRALDIGSAAVLMASFGAAIVGAIVFLHRLGEMLAWW